MKRTLEFQPQKEETAIAQVISSPLSVEEKFQKLGAIADICTMCDLCRNRTHAVFGEGPLHAKAMLIGEGPGKTEDMTGRPYVGSAGRHLERVMIKVGLNRKDLYITNIVKCHHRGQKPTMREINACHPYMQAQLDYIQPKLLILTGTSAMKALLGTSAPITKIHGVLMDTPYQGIKAISVFHPSYLIYRESLSEDSPLWQVWEEDWRKIKKAIERL
jgi:uracil-DNA glycosylase family 4